MLWINIFMKLVVDPVKSRYKRIHVLSVNLCKLCVRCSACSKSQPGALGTCGPLAVLSNILDEHSFMLGYSCFAGVRGKRIIEHSTLYSNLLS